MIESPGNQEPCPPDIVRATIKGRILSLISITLAIGLVATFLLWILPRLNTLLISTPSLNAIATLRYTFIGFAALAILPAIVMIATGRQILCSGQWPPPNAWIWRDTRIRRGYQATCIGWACIASGALTCVLCAAIVGYIWSMFEQVIPKHKLRPGVVILQEHYAKP